MLEFKNNLLLQLNSIRGSDIDSTLKIGNFSIIDDGISGNRGKSGYKQMLSQDAMDDIAKTILNKPVVAKYYPITENYNSQDDGFGDHEVVKIKNRNGEDIISTETIPIGHFITEGNIENNGDKNIITAECVFYADRFPNEVELLEKWINEGIDIQSSSEYFYNSYEVKDNIEIVKSPVIFSGHCILQSEENENHSVIQGAYESSTLLSLNQKQEWNNMLSKSINNKIDEFDKMSKNKKGDIMEGMLKKVCQLSHDDIRYQLYNALEQNLSASEYWDAWLYDVYDDKFIYAMWNAEESMNEYFEVMYTKTEDSVEVDFEGQTKVQRDWVSVSNQLEEKETELEKANNSIQELQSKIDELEKSVNSEVEEVVVEDAVDETAEALEKATNQIVELSETVASLNSKLEELSEIKAQRDLEIYEKTLNERKDSFEVKFKALNAMDKFESDEVQTMIKDSIENDTILASLNSMVVDLVSLPKQEEKKEDGVKVYNSKKVGDLIPEDKKGINEYIVE